MVSSRITISPNGGAGSARAGGLVCFLLSLRLLPGYLPVREMSTATHVPLFALLMVSVCAVPAAHGATFYVSPAGQDDGPGGVEQPFRTLEAARDAVRALPVKGGHTVYLRGGTYSRSATFTLSAEDSGRPGRPNVYATLSNETAVVTGSLAVSPESIDRTIDPDILERIPGAARASIVSIDYRDLGLAVFDRAVRQARPPDIYWDGEPMRLARWPNEGYLKTGKIVRTGSVPRNWRPDMAHRKEYVPPEERDDPPLGGIFEYEGTRPVRWSRASGIRMKGFWKVDWYTEVLTVKSIDTEARHIETVEPHLYGIVADRRYYVFDLPEELDAPGEFYVDRDARRLYLYPFPGDGAAPAVHITRLEDALFAVNQASNVVLRGVELGMSGGDLVRISGGRDNLVAGCRLRHAGGRAVGIHGGLRHGVVSCDVDTVHGGITITGGDRKTLTPGGHYARNNRVRNYSRYGATYTPAISVRGVGNVAAHNEISDGSHTAMQFGGNEHVIEYNEFHDVCRESDDMGAAYSGRNVTYRGNVFRYNYFHDIQSTVPSRVGTMGLYFDDQISGTTVFGNVFRNVPIGVFVNGGRDNVVANNLFVDVPMSVRLSAWGLHPIGVGNFATHGYGTLMNPHSMGPPEVAYNEPPYTRYHHLADILEDEPCWPKYNRVSDNLLYRSGDLVLSMAEEEGRKTKIRGDNRLEEGLHLDREPDLRGATLYHLVAGEPERIRATCPAFEPLPLSEMGLQFDVYRKRLTCRPPVLTPTGGRAYREAVVRMGPSIVRRNGEAGVIRYTTDGSDPGPGSVAYEGPVTLARSCTVKARVFPADATRWDLSPVATAEFVVDSLAYLGNLVPVDADGHGGLEVNADYHGETAVSIAGTAYTNSLLVCPRGSTGFGHVTYDLRELPVFRRFTAVIGIEDFVEERGSCEFIVEGLVNGTWEERYRSPVLRGGDTGVPVDVDVSGFEQLRLKTTIAGDNGYSDHALWAEPLLHP